jgi:hypothetical protein
MRRPAALVDLVTGVAERLDFEVRQIDVVMDDQDSCHRTALRASVAITLLPTATPARWIVQPWDDPPRRGSAEGTDLGGPIG